MFALFLLITILVLATCHWYYKRRKLPPGPPAVPLLGSLPFLDIRRGFIDWTLDPRVTKHRIATVSLNPSLTPYIINNLKLAKEVFEKDVLSYRPSTDWTDRLVMIDGVRRGILLSSGENWIKHRKFGLKTLKGLGFGRRNIENIVNEEIELIISELGRSKEDYLMSSVFNIPVINVLWQLVAGHSFNVRNTEHRNLTNDIIIFVGNLLIFYTIPLKLIKIFRNNFFLKNDMIFNNNKKYIQDQIEDHRATLDRENPRDFIDVYLTAMEDDEGLNTDDLTMCLYDFLLAGTDTTSTTLKWMVLYLTLYQEVQDRCREEIKEVIGDNRCTIEDIQRLPYTKATVSEVQRHGAIVPLSFGRNKRAINLEGYSIPPDSIVLANLQFIMRDPEHIKHPEAFNPDRFIGEDGRYKKHPAMVPFGVGKRQCMGEALARNQLMLFSVGLIQRLIFLPPDSGAMPDPQDYHVSITRIPADFRVKICKI